MLIILPFISLIFIFLNLSIWIDSRIFIFREKIISSLIIWASIVVAITEIINIPHQINTPLATIYWIIVTLTLLIIYFINPCKFKTPLRTLISIPETDKEEKVMLSIISVILLTTFILAIKVAPNNIDAMSYQLTRILYWMQNESISFYPTNISWQINNGQLASFFNLNFYLLSKGDYLTNSLQWIFFIGSIMGVSLMTKELGINTKGQVMSAFICSTIPMAILQASATHDVIIVSFFILSFIYFSLRFLSTTKKLLLILAGLSLGLALLTKQIAYIYTFPFCIWILFLFLKKFEAKKTFKYTLLLFITATLINLPFYTRNIVFSGLPIFSIRNDYINTPLGASSTTSNMIKNLSLNLSTPSQPLNSRIHATISLIMNMLHIPENDPGLNWVNFKFGIPPAIASEYTAPNTIHLILLFVSIAYLFKKPRIKISREYIWCIFIGFMIFSTIFKWQSSGSHFLTQLFILTSPFIAITTLRSKARLRYALIFLLSISSFYYLFFNIQKPIISEVNIFNQSREQQYFKFRPELYDPYKEIASFVKKGEYKNVGVIFKEYSSEMEYPLWILLKKEGANITIEHVAVENSTAKLSKGFKPDIIVFIGTDKNKLKQYLDQHIPIIGIE